MSDRLRSDHFPEAGEVPERERDAQVESLLLAGLDHYFVGQHELAISVWTRVLFLDRGHARAKAYIDRARGAIAERQREGEELLHTGAAAVDRGDAGAARRLLNSAVERGAASEEALVLLDRLNRLEHANVRPARRIASGPQVGAAEHPAPAGEQSTTARLVWIATGVLAGLAVAGPGPAQAIEPLPVPASAEIWLARARKQYEDGRLHDALSTLQAIAPTDSLKGDADELKAAIQSRLLEAARKSPALPK
jgi:hypothetical protein